MASARPGYWGGMGTSGSEKPTEGPSLRTDAVGGAWARAAAHLAQVKHQEDLFFRRLLQRPQTFRVFPDIQGRPGGEPGGRGQVWGSGQAWGSGW